MPYRQIRYALLFAVSLLTFACSQTSGPTLTPAEALAKARAGEVTLIDVRTPPEWRQTGVAPMARRIDMHDPKGPDGFAERVLNTVEGDTSAPIALICRTGNRSSRMQRELQSRGFTHVYNVLEGMAGSQAGPGWIRRGLPVQTCTNC